MKIYLAIFITAATTFLITHFTKDFAEKAALAECESTIKDIGSQLEQVKKEYGTYKSGLGSLKYQKAEKCRVIEADQNFGELSPQFDDGYYRLYFYVLGNSRRFGKLESGNLQYLE